MFSWRNSNMSRRFFFVILGPDFKASSYFSKRWHIISLSLGNWKWELRSHGFNISCLIYLQYKVWMWNREALLLYLCYVYIGDSLVSCRIACYVFNRQKKLVQKRTSISFSILIKLQGHVILRELPISWRLWFILVPQNSPSNVILLQ